MSDSPELLKPTEVTDDKLHTELGNLELENEELRRQLENSDRLIHHKNQEISELNSRLAVANQKISELDDRTEELESENQNLKFELAGRPEQNSTPIAIELPEPGDLLNQLKARRKKSRADLGDIETVLEILSYPEE